MQAAEKQLLTALGTTRANWEEELNGSLFSHTKCLTSSDNSLELLMKTRLRTMYVVM